MLGGYDYRTHEKHIVYALGWVVAANVLWNLEKLYFL